MFKTILAGIDNGETCDAIFKRALNLARAVNAELILLGVLLPVDGSSVLQPVAVGGDYGFPDIDESVQSVYQERYRAYEIRELDRLATFKERAEVAGVKARYLQRSGSAGRVICEEAKLHDADLVIVGSHGRMGWNEILLGSVSNYVMHHAVCSVLVIHDRDQLPL